MRHLREEELSGPILAHFGSCCLEGRLFGGHFQCSEAMKHVGLLALAPALCAAQVRGVAPNDQAPAFEQSQ